MTMIGTLSSPYTPSGDSARQEDGCTGVFLDQRNGNERCRVQEEVLRGIVLWGTSLLEEN